MNFYSAMQDFSFYGGVYRSSKNAKCLKRERVLSIQVQISNSQENRTCTQESFKTLLFFPCIFLIVKRSHIFFFYTQTFSSNRGIKWGLCSTRCGKKQVTVAWSFALVTSVHHWSLSKWGLFPTLCFFQMGLWPIDGFYPTNVYWKRWGLAFAQHGSLSKWGLWTCVFCRSSVFVQMGCMPSIGLLPNQEFWQALSIWGLFPTWVFPQQVFIQKLS